MHALFARTTGKSPRVRPRRRCENIVLGRWVVMIEMWKKLTEYGIASYRVAYFLISKVLLSLREYYLVSQFTRIYFNFVKLFKYVS